MALGSMFLFLALLIIVALIVASPFVDKKTEAPLPTDKLSHWLAERDRILDALAELDSDWHLGKVPEDIYPIQRRQLVAKGAQVLEKIEKESKKAPIIKKSAIQKTDDLEEMIAVYKAQHKTGK